MDVHNLLDHIQELSDLELAVLLSLIAQGHCLMSTEDDLIDDLANELSLIVSEKFGLSYAVLGPEEFSTVDRFGEAILEDQGTQFSTDDDPQPGSLRARLANLDIRVAPRPFQQRDRSQSGLDSRMIKNVVIAKGFNLADPAVQVQAIEIISNRRILSHTAVHITPKTFLFIPLVTSSSKDMRLVPHLNDRVFISHFHHPLDGFANLEELDHSVSSDGSSNPSKNRSSWESAKASRIIGRDVIEKLRGMGVTTAITPDIRRYMQDIVIFLRIERGVDGGMTPRATTEFVALAKYLAPLHGINYVTPSLVALAARKVYLHRVTISEPGRERSLQYGSDPETVTELLDGMTPYDAIEAVLNTVPCPI